MGMPVLLGIFAAAVLVLSIAVTKKGAGRNTLTKNDIRQLDPSFSVEYFIGTLMNKVTSIHYAGSWEQISAFFEKGAEHCLPKYDDVIECKLQNYLLLKYETDSSYQYLTVEVTLVLTHDTQNRLEKRNGKAADLFEEKHGCRSQ